MLFLENRVYHNVFIISDDLITCDKKKNEIFFFPLNSFFKSFQANRNHSVQFRGISSF